MTKDTDGRELWRDELGDFADPVWDAFKTADPPELRVPQRQARHAPWMLFGIAASWVAIGILLAWNAQLRNDVTEARTQTALALLVAERSDRVLAGLATVRQLDADPAITAALLKLLKESDDPNLQLEALDLLINGVLSDMNTRRDVLEQVRFNRSFLERAIRAREVRT